MKMMKLLSISLAIATLYSLQPIQAQFSIPRTYVAFVVDNTGSMSNEMEDVKVWMEKCTKGMYDDCKNIPSGGWILSPFNDPVADSGPVTGPTTVQSEILQGIDNLEAVKGSGGDCPEMAMHGIMSALKDVTPHNIDCKVFFFSDATPKDYSRMEEVKSELLKKRCTFYPVLTRCCGTCSDPCITLPPAYCETNVENKLRRRRSVVSNGTFTDERAYYHLAYATGGKIHLLKKAPKGHLLKFLEEELKIVSCSTDEVAGPPPNGFNEDQCRFAKSCWDGRNKTCYCHKRGQCPQYTTTEAPTTTEATTTPITTTKFPPPDCRKTKGVTFLVDYNDCSKYYLCYMGHRYHFDCRSGTAFRRDLLRCDSLENVAPPCGTNHG